MTLGDESGAVDVKTIIVGAGFAGIGAAVRLLQAGESDFVILERADQLGGTWRDNRYPGCRCDVPSHLYSYSFAPNPDWQRTYADQEDIWAYMRSTAGRFGVVPHIRFSHDVHEARWDERGPLGPLHQPARRLAAGTSSAQRAPSPNRAPRRSPARARSRGW